MDTPLTELAPALVKAQASFKPAAMTGRNPHFKSRFATLGDVWEAVAPSLAAHGLAVIQTTRAQDDGGLTVVTTLLHTSGQSLTGEVRMPISAPASAQQVGSALTYGRRYGLAALLGIVADEDDDGNAASASPKGGAPEARPRNDAAPRMPFGKTKGKLLRDLTDDELQSASDWCSETDEKRKKFADLIADLLTEIDRRGHEEAHGH